MSTPTETIIENHKRKHLHPNRNKKRCSHCANFISLPKDETGQVRTQCTNCGRWQLKYVPKTESATGD